MSKYKVLDLFAGCGGLSKGFEMAGFEIVAANEYWEPAGKTFVKNHPRSKFSSGDITLKKTKEEVYSFFKDAGCDVIIGGPPCQAYSVAGFRDPNDPRGDLFNDYLEVVSRLRPKVVVIENVKGLVTMKQDRDDLTNDEKKELTMYKNMEKEKNELLLLRRKHKNNPSKFKFERKQETKLEELKKECNELKGKLDNSHRELVSAKIIRGLKKLGYQTKFKVLKASDFGVPQKRERIIFIGALKEFDIEFPTSTHGSSDQLSLENKLPWVTVREAIDDLKNLPEDKDFNQTYTVHSKEFIKKIKATPIGQSVIGGYSDAFFRNPPDEPSRTVKENHGSVMVHYEKDRVLTPRELARLQSFPDDFIFEGSKSEILTQIGNAVPPLLGEVIGGNVLKILKQNYKNSTVVRDEFISDSFPINQ